VDVMLKQICIYVFTSFLNVKIWTQATFSIFFVSILCLSNHCLVSSIHTQVVELLISLFSNSMSTLNPLVIDIEIFFLA
jgi:hypothetical protein